MQRTGRGLDMVAGHCGIEANVGDNQALTLPRDVEYTFNLVIGALGHILLQLGKLHGIRARFTAYTRPIMTSHPGYKPTII